MSNNIMTPEEFKDEMKKASELEIHMPEYGIIHRHDTEESHAMMDNIMCKLLRSLGYGDGIDIFDKTYKFYA